MHWDPWIGQRLGLSANAGNAILETPAEMRVDLGDVEVEGRYEHIFRYVAQTPWALTPEVLGVVTDLLAYRMEGHRLTADELDERIGRSAEDAKAEAAARSGPKRTSGRGGAVGVMSLYGMIAPRASMVSGMSGPSGTGLDAFSRQLQELVDDPEVASIVIDVNSPGGTVDMVPETAARMRAARDQKPIYAVANTDAGSAAYWLMAQATEASVTPSGMVGSIGVYSAHQDLSAKYELEGRKTTLISAGKFKVERNPFEALGDEAREAIQATVDGYYDWFVDDVARGRGVKTSAVRSGYGEGRMLMAKPALAEGLVDRIDTLEGVVQRALSGKAPKKRAGAASDHLPTLTTDGEAALAGNDEIPVDSLQYLNL